MMLSGIVELRLFLLTSKVRKCVVKAEQGHSRNDYIKYVSVDDDDQGSLCTEKKTQNDPA